MMDGVEDGGIDMEVYGTTWEKVLKRTWCAFSQPKEETEIAGKQFVVVYEGKRAAKLRIPGS